MAAILYIMAKLKARFYAHSLGIELNVMTILPLNNIFYSAILQILKMSSFSLPTTTTLKLPLWRVF